MDSELYSFYKETLKEIKVEIKDYLERYDELSFSKRLELENQFKRAGRIDEMLGDLSGRTTQSVTGYVRDELQQGYNGVWYAIEGTENVQLDFGMLPERYINELVTKKVDGKNFSTRLYQYRKQLADRTTTALLSAAANGEGYRKVAKQIGELTEANYKQALRIARTEGGRVQSTAKQKAYEEAENIGVKLEKRWLATLDKKTRTQHQILDGQTVGVDEKFKFDGYEADGPRLFGNASLDVNCRCTTIGIVNGISPATRKDGETGGIVEYKTYNEWAGKRAPKTVESKPNIKINDTISSKLSDKQLREVTGYLGNAPEEIRAMWNKYADDLNWGSTADGSYFSAQTRYAFIKPEHLKRDNMEAYNTLFHEMAHNIDSVAAEKAFGDRFKFISTRYSDEFTDRLKKDGNNYIKLQQKRIKQAVKEQWDDSKGNGYQKIVLDGIEMLTTKKVPIRDAKAFVGQELMAYDFKEIGSVSDIFEGATGVYSKGGHGSKYWKNKDMLSREAFAHMTQASINNDKSLANLKKFFPTAYEEYFNVVKFINEL